MHQQRDLLPLIRLSHVQRCLWFLGALNGQRSHSVFAIREGPVSFHREVPSERVEARAGASAGYSHLVSHIFFLY